MEKLSKSSRQIAIYDLIIRLKDGDASQVTLESLIGKHLGKPGSVASMSRQINGIKYPFRISKIIESGSFYFLLLDTDDPDAPPPVFRNRQTGELREVPQGEHDDQSFSAHMVISKVPRIENLLARYHCAIERVPRIGSTYAILLLNELVKNTTIPSGDEVLKPALRMLPLASTSLMDQLKKGMRIVDFVGMHRIRQGGVDCPSLSSIEISKRHIVNSKATAELLADRIKEFGADHLKEKPKKGETKYVAVNTKTGTKSKQIRYYGREEIQAFEKLFTLSCDLESPVELKQCHDEIVTPFADLIKETLVREVKNATGFVSQ